MSLSYVNGFVIGNVLLKNGNASDNTNPSNPVPIAVDPATGIIGSPDGVDEFGQPLSYATLAGIQATDSIATAFYKLDNLLSSDTNLINSNSAQALNNKNDIISLQGDLQAIVDAINSGEPAPNPGPVGGQINATVDIQSLVLLLEGSPGYSAKKAGSGVLVADNVVNDDFNTSISSGIIVATGSLITAIVKDTDDAELGTDHGNRIIIAGTGNDQGTYNQLQIISDFDPYEGTVNAGATVAISVRILASNFPPSNVNKMYYQLKVLDGTNNRFSNRLEFFKDDAASLGTPTVSGASLTGVNVINTGYASGVPVISTNSTIQATFTGNNIVGLFYNPTKGATLGSNLALPDENRVFNTVNIAADWNGIPSPNASVNFTATATVAANKFNPDAKLYATVYNSAGNASAPELLVSPNKLNVDSLSIIKISGGEQFIRYRCGAGQFPADDFGTNNFGTTYDHNVNLLTAGYTEEAQLLGGYYQYPSINYATGYTPIGPDYSGILNTRYVVIKSITITDAVRIHISIQGAVNFGTEAITPNFELYVGIYNATTGVRQIKWIDANANYALITPGEINDGVGGMNALDSTPTSRLIELINPKTGVVVVRAGFPNGTTVKFSGITVVSG